MVQSCPVNVLRTLYGLPNARAARRGSPRGPLNMHHPGQRRGLRLCSSGAEDEGSERIVTALAGLLQRSTIAGEGDFRGGQLQEWSSEPERAPVIE